MSTILLTQTWFYDSIIPGNAVTTYSIDSNWCMTLVVVSEGTVQNICRGYYDFDIFSVGKITTTNLKTSVSLKLNLDVLKKKLENCEPIRHRNYLFTLLQNYKREQRFSCSVLLNTLMFEGVSPIDHDIAWMLKTEYKLLNDCNFKALNSFMLEINGISFDLCKKQILTKYNQEILYTPYKMKGAFITDRPGISKQKQIISLALLNPSYIDTCSFMDKRMLSKATLIVCPGHLCEQWKQKILLMSDKKVIMISSEQDHGNTSYKDVILSDFVVVSTDIFKYMLEDLTDYNNCPDVALDTLFQETFHKYTIFTKKRPVLFIMDFYRIVYDEFQTFDEDFIWVADNLYSKKIWLTSKTINGANPDISFIARYISNYPLSNLPLETIDTFKKFIRYSPTKYEKDYIEQTIPVKQNETDVHFDGEQVKWGSASDLITVVNKQQLDEIFVKSKVPHDIDNNTCPICYDDSVTTLFNSCGHKFCYICVEKWRLHSTEHFCPFCRSPMVKLYSLEVPKYYTQKALDFIKEIKIHQKYKTIIYCSEQLEAFDLFTILQEEHISTLYCIGNSNRRMDILSKFTNKLNSRVIIISSLDDVSGYDFKFVKKIIFWRKPDSFIQKTLVASCKWGYSQKNKISVVKFCLDH